MVDTLANTLVLGMAREGTPVAQAVKNLPSMQETWVRSLGLEDILAKGTATHSHILAWRIPWTEKLGGLQSMGSQSVRHNWVTNTFREGKGGTNGRGGRTEKAGITGGEMKLIYIRSAVDSMDGTECARLVLWPETWAEISPAFLSRPVTGRLRMCTTDAQFVLLVNEVFEKY